MSTTTTDHESYARVQKAVVKAHKECDEARKAALDATKKTHAAKRAEHAANQRWATADSLRLGAVSDLVIVLETMNET